MRWTLIATLLSALILLTACKSSQDRQLADVPPPPPSSLDTASGSSMDFVEPLPPLPMVPVEPMAPAPTVTFDQAAPAPAAALRPMPAGTASQTYTVRKGDTLWSIAARHYGDGKMWTAIVDANPGIDPKKLAVGQTITLP